ncbi:MAG TPA: nucleoside triphosphate pyrophosphohydrolase family protein [Alphaproteobacteria bacterium]|nr:nucleoside triphosphate pyrophosphohydrolase family protein [Alphaproteobacteria bacterium]
MSKTNFHHVRDFHARFGVAPNANLLDQRESFLREEAAETYEAIANLRNAQTPGQQKQAKAHLLKELVDVLYVTYGFIDLLGLDADKAFAEVQRSNMSKTPNAEPGGKVQKGLHYSPANMEQFV